MAHCRYINDSLNAPTLIPLEWCGIVVLKNIFFDMCMKYNNISWYSGLATVIRRDSGNFPNWQDYNKGFLTCRIQFWSQFFRTTPENLDNPENSFHNIGDFQAGRKKGFQIRNLHPKKPLFKKRKNVFFYVCIKSSNTLLTLSNVFPKLLALNYILS